MNKAILMGRLTREPEIRYSNGADGQLAIARYTLAVDRRFKRQGDEQTADFINCVVFGKGAEFAEGYLHQGTKIVVEGRIQTGSYVNKEGQKVYTTEVIVESQEFAESKAASSGYNGGNFGGGGGYQQAAPSRPNPSEAAGEGFMNLPGAEDEQLPFK